MTSHLVELVAGGSLLVACFHPSYDRLACAPDGTCPSGFACSEASVCLPPGDQLDAAAPSIAARPGQELPSSLGPATTCGASSNDSCCYNAEVPGGTYYRSFDVATDGSFADKGAPATVSSFRLDKYPATVGRFRAFVNAGMGTLSNPPSAGVGAHAKLLD